MQEIFAGNTLMLLLVGETQLPQAAGEEWHRWSGLGRKHRETLIEYLSNKTRLGGIYIVLMFIWCLDWLHGFA